MIFGSLSFRRSNCDGVSAIGDRTRLESIGGILNRPERGAINRWLTSVQL
jgi:hypothetical protein